MSVDDRIISMLNQLLFTSRLRTSLSIRLADHAAQLLGFRSTRQVGEGSKDDVEEAYQDLTNKLISTVYEFKNQIESRTRDYKPQILNYSELELELLLENTLFDAIIYDDATTFMQSFLV